MKKRLLSAVFPLGSVCLLVLVYYIVSIGFDSELIVPSIPNVAKSLGYIVREDGFVNDIFGTLARAISSYVFAFVTAFAFSLFASISRIVEKIFYPVTVIARAIPTMSVVLLCVLWLKADKLPIAVSFIVMFPMLYASILGVLSSRDKQMTEMIKVYRVPKSKAFCRYYFPDTVIRLFPQLVSTLSFNVKLTISGEALAYTPNSIGNELKVANINIETAEIMAWTVVAILLSFVVELLLYGIFHGIKRIRYEYRIRKFN